MHSRKKVIFHQKKAPAASLRTKKQHFFTKKRPLRACTAETKSAFNEKSLFFVANRCINLLYFSYIFPLLGPFKGGGHPSLGIPITEQTPSSHIYYIHSTYFTEIDSEKKVRSFKKKWLHFTKVAQNEDLNLKIRGVILPRRDLQRIRLLKNRNRFSPTKSHFERMCAQNEIS